MPSGYARAALAAFERMRRETNNFLSDANSKDEQKLSLSALLDRFRSILRLFKRWKEARRNPVFSEPFSCLMIYAPTRTPAHRGEDNLQFLERIGRTNRQDPLPRIFDIRRPDDVLCLEVHPILGLGQSESKHPSIIDFVFSVISWRHVVKLAVLVLKTALRRRDIWQEILTETLEILGSHLKGRSIKMLFLTSNSILVELLRLAALPNDGIQTIEVLHGTASGMESYYKFIDQQAKRKPIYVNLISGLPFFDSIGRHMLADDAGEIAASCGLWSTVPDDSVIVLPTRLLARPPLVIVGGVSDEGDYFRSQFFAGEARLISMLHSFFPDDPIVYCPHPRIKGHPAIGHVAEQLHVSIADRTTLEMLFVSRAAFGTFSTSLFEAAILGKPVFLLPFDHRMMIPELLALTFNCRSLESLETDLRRFELQDSVKGVSFERTCQRARETLGVTLKLAD